MGQPVVTLLPAQHHAAGAFLVEAPTSGMAPGTYTLRLVRDGAVLTQALLVQ